MRRMLIIAAAAALLAGCGDRTPEQKVDAAFAELGADPATIAQQKVIDGDVGPRGGALNRTIYLVPKKDGPGSDGSDLWIVDEQGEIHDGYYAFLRDNDLTR